MIKTLSIGLSIVDAVLSAVASEKEKRTGAGDGEKTEGQSDPDAKTKKNPPEVIEGYESILEMLTREE
jgi:hypothetical protein